ncbi:hypothetical protein Droror1_Dr00017421 [Drosera rotundifolia]
MKPNHETRMNSMSELRRWLRGTFQACHAQLIAVRVSTWLALGFHPWSTGHEDWTRIPSTSLSSIATARVRVLPQMDLAISDQTGESPPGFHRSSIHKTTSSSRHHHQQPIVKARDPSSSPASTLSCR